MNKPNPDLGGRCPSGDPSGRIWQPPVSVEQAKARLLNAMTLLEANCADGFEVGYANQCFNEATDDYFQMVYYGDVDEGRQQDLEAQVWELQAHAAIRDAEKVVYDAMRDLGDGEA